MKLAFSTLGCPGWSFEEIFATAKDLGMDGIEIRGIGTEMYAPKAAPFAPQISDRRPEKDGSPAAGGIPAFSCRADAFTVCFDDVCPSAYTGEAACDPDCLR